MTLNLEPLSTVELALISLTASSMASLATLPMVESKVKIAPTFTTTGLEEVFTLKPSDDTPRESVESKTIQNTLILHTHYEFSIQEIITKTPNFSPTKECTNSAPLALEIPFQFSQSTHIDNSQ